MLVLRYRGVRELPPPAVGGVRDPSLLERMRRRAAAVARADCANDDPASSSGDTT